jgi:putative transposase
LPHWQRKDAAYFITFRLADAIPTKLLSQWETEHKCWLRPPPEPWSFEVEQEYHRRLSGTIERWLDASRGSPCCAKANMQNWVGNTLQRFDGACYAQIAWLGSA